MPTSSNYLCGCGRFMRPKKNSVTVEELTEDGRPYKLFDADLWECPECGVEIIVGFGKGPIAEHYQPTYAAQRARLQPIYPGRCRPPEGWPSCVTCGEPALDGHRTCGRVECNESGAREARG